MQNCIFLHSNEPFYNTTHIFFHSICYCFTHLSLTAPLLNAYILFYLHHLLHHRTLHHQQSQYSSHSANLYNNTKLVCTTLHQLIYHHIFIFCRYRYTVIFFLLLDEKLSSNSPKHSSAAFSYNTEIL